MPKKYKYQKKFTIDGKQYVVRADTKKELTEKEIRKRVQIEKGENKVDSTMRLRDWA